MPPAPPAPGSPLRKLRPAPKRAMPASTIGTVLRVVILPAGSIIVGVTKITRFFLLVCDDSLRKKRRFTSACTPNMVAIPPPCLPVRAAEPTYRRGRGFHVGFLGRIVEEKGVEHLVDAFLALDDPDARLLIGGEHESVAGGSVVARVRAHAGDDDRIHLLGFVPDQRLAEFYASIDAFALPSVNAFEAFGIVQVVGMLAGVPALVSDLPGVRLPVARTGFGRIVPAADVGSPLCEMMNRAAFPSGDRKEFIARLKSGFSKTSGGRSTRTGGR